MNKKRELRGLFHKYIDRKEKESRIVSYPSRNPYYGGGSNIGSSSFRGDFNGCIYFYEWSNINREPMKFFTIEGFSEFLRVSCIYLALYQKDMLKSLKWTYVTCKKGSKELIIRQSYIKLKEALEENNSSVSTNKGGENSIGFQALLPSGVDREPYAVSITRLPHLKEEFEPEGKWFG